MKEDRRIAKSKDALKNALIALLKEKEIEQITITDLVNRSNLNRGTFYYHFQSIEGLLDELVNDVKTDFIKAYKAPYLHMERFMISNLTVHSVSIFNHILAYSDFYSIVIGSAKLSALQNEWIDLLRNLMKQNYHLVMNKNRKVDIDLLIAYRAYALFGLITEWVKSNYQHPPEYMAEQLIEIISDDLKKIVVDTAKIDRFPDILH